MGSTTASRLLRNQILAFPMPPPMFKLENGAIIRALHPLKKKQLLQQQIWTDIFGVAEVLLVAFFGLISLFNGISTFVGYLIPKPFS